MRFSLGAALLPVAAILAAPAWGGPSTGLSAGPAVAVIADISPGVNPYHEAFRRPTWTAHPATRIPGFPKSASRLDLTLGRDYAASRDRDAAVWARYRPGTLYWIPRTNLILYTGRTLSSYGGGRPDGNPGTFHGTGTAAAASRNCAACYVLVVIDVRNLDGEPIRRIADSWPWVDVVTTTNYTGDLTYASVDAAYPGATKRLTETGRLFVAPTGNTPVTGVTPVPYPAVVLPPWVVAVGGAHSRCHAAEVQAGRPATFAGDFTESFPATESTTGWVAMSGTSFTAPQVAGAFGRALVEVRRLFGPARVPGALWAGRAGPGALRDGRLTADEVYDAFTATARYFQPTEFEPAKCPSPDSSLTSLPAPVPVSATPWVDLGWGYVGEAEATRAAAVLLGRAPRPGKPAAAVAYLAAVQQARATAYR